MIRFVYIFMVLSAFMWIIYGFKYKQIGAVIKCDPEYLVNCTTLTRRVKRGEAYKTNVTVTMLSPLKRNTTFKIYFRQRGQPEIEMFNVDECEAMKHQWLVDFFHKYSDIKNSCCMKAGTYHVWNFELPPKNIPLPLPSGDLVIRLIWTSTSHHPEKTIIDFTMKLFK